MSVFETLQANQFTLAFVPVYASLVFILYSLVRHVPTGLGELFSGLFFIPFTALGSYASWYLLKTFTSAQVSVALLTIGAVISIIRTLIRMASFKKVAVSSTVKSSSARK
jgi:hypothetical protein